MLHLHFTVGAQSIFFENAAPIYVYYSGVGYFFVSTVYQSPLTPERPQIKRPPPSLQITSNFLVFYWLSHGTTFEKNGVAQNLIYSKN